VADTAAELARDHRRNYACSRLLKDGMRWFVEWTRFRLVLATTISSHKRCQSRYSQRVAVGFGNGLYGEYNACPRKQSYLPRVVVWLHFTMNGDAIDNKALDAARNPLQRILCQRLFAVENAGAGIDQSMHSAAVRHGASLPASTAGDFGSP
jgi:hypothetical protein